MNTKEKKSVREEVMDALLADRHERPKIFFVEDDPDVREALRLLLEKKYDVVGISDGRRLLETIDSYGANLLILDVNLPGKDGFELCRIVRSSPKYRDLPVLFLTVHRDDESFVKSIQTNADAYLNKPFAPRELVDTIERLVGPRGRDMEG